MPAAVVNERRVFRLAAAAALLAAGARRTPTRPSPRAPTATACGRSRAEDGRGLSRNRVYAGLRATVAGALDLDLCYLREERDGGRCGLHALVARAVLVLGAR